MIDKYRTFASQQLESIKKAGLYKKERVILTPQGRELAVGEERVINFCANNYLGLANHPGLVKAAQQALEKWGYGLSSVRFICGTQAIHKELEEKISYFLEKEDTILYTSCFDANGGLFETLLSSEDAIISDRLNHASIIDGIRLSKAKRALYKNCDMDDLERALKETAESRFRLIITDGVFSMDGTIAPLDTICQLAEKYGALVAVDDSHSVGILGEGGRGTSEHYNVSDRVHIVTGTLGKALGGASGGYISGKREIIELLRQRSRPYLFSNTVAPSIVAASLAGIDILTESQELRERLRTNTERFRKKIKSAGFTIKEGEHPIVPVMLGESHLAQSMADKLLERGIYVIGFFYPVVPEGEARIRVQLSAVHTDEDIDFAVEQFKSVKEELS